MKKHDLPAMPFYVGDWRKSPEIRALPLEARAVWFEILCLMWEMPRRGYLSLDGKTAISTETLSRMIGESVETTENALSIIEKSNVFSREENSSIIYNRRMVKDEEIRVTRSLSGDSGMRKRYYKDGFVITNTLTNTLTKPLTNSEIENENENENEDYKQPDSYTNITKRVKNSNMNNIYNFNIIWNMYPSKTGKKQAEKHFKSSVKTEEDFTNIKKALENYLRSKRVANGYIQNGSTWFNNWQDWIDYQEFLSPEEEHKKMMEKLGIK